MKIRIEMDMPTKCALCPFFSHQYEYGRECYIQASCSRNYFGCYDGYDFDGDIVHRLCKLAGDCGVKEEPLTAKEQ